MAKRASLGPERIRGEMEKAKGRWKERTRPVTKKTEPVRREWSPTVETKTAPTVKSTDISKMLSSGNKIEAYGSRRKT